MGDEAGTGEASFGDLQDASFAGLEVPQAGNGPLQRAALGTSDARTQLLGPVDTTQFGAVHHRAGDTTASYSAPAAAINNGSSSSTSGRVSSSSIASTSTPAPAQQPPVDANNRPWLADIVVQSDAKRPPWFITAPNKLHNVAAMTAVAVFVLLWVLRPSFVTYEDDESHVRVSPKKLALWSLGAALAVMTTPSWLRIGKASGPALLSAGMGAATSLR